MVSTREILYVLLISLAAGGPYLGGALDPDNAYINGIGSYLPLLLLLLFSTDNGCGCVDRNGRSIPGISPACAATPPFPGGGCPVGF